MAKRVIKTIVFVILVLIICAAGFLAYVFMSEYKPADRETLEVFGTGAAQQNSAAGQSSAAGPLPGPQLSSGQDLRIVTWNVGYGALGEDADFFMDGGESVKTADEEGVLYNMTSIIDSMKSLQADVYFIQEIDRDSSRSSHVDEAAMMFEAFGIPEEAGGRSANGMSASFANNFKTPFVPYPVPPIGKVDSGILTISKYPVASAERVSLPCPFKWPVRAVNLKRCLMIDRIPIGHATANVPQRELVLIDLHLEAYDSGEGKLAQTQMLREILEEEYAKGNYVIAGGDFNQSFPSVDLSAYPAQEGLWAPGTIGEDDFGKTWSLLMDDKVPTCRSLDKAYKDADRDTFQYYVIDGFIVSDNVKVRKMKTKQMDFVNTDHNPVVLDVTLK